MRRKMDRKCASLISSSEPYNNPAGSLLTISRVLSRWLMELWDGGQCCAFPLMEQHKATALG